MCGRYSLKRSDFATYEEWMTYRKSQYDDVHSNPIYNAAPTMKLPVILEGESGTEVRWMRWGLLQPWNRERNDAFKTFNAKSETLAEKPTWKKPFRSQRCLVIADGFFEWKKEPEGTDLFGSGTGKDVKKPYRIRLKSKDQFAMAGLYNSWTDPATGEVTDTFAIVTTGANDLMKPLHDRMPVILPDEAHRIWMDRRIQNPEDLTGLLTQYPSDQMELFGVTARIGNARYQEPDALDPV